MNSSSRTDLSRAEAARSPGPPNRWKRQELNGRWDRWQKNDAYLCCTFPISGSLSSKQLRCIHSKSVSSWPYRFWGCLAFSRYASFKVILSAVLLSEVTESAWPSTLLKEAIFSLLRSLSFEAGARAVVNFQFHVPSSWWTFGTREERVNRESVTCVNTSLRLCNVKCFSCFY